MNDEAADEITQLQQRIGEAEARIATDSRLVEHQAAEIERLRAINAELVEALQSFLQARSPFWDGEEMDRATEKARAAIAKATNPVTAAIASGRAPTMTEVSGVMKDAEAAQYHGDVDGDGELT